MHSTVSGLADQMAGDEFEGIEMARRWVNTVRVGQQVVDCRIAVVAPLHSSGFLSWND